MDESALDIEGLTFSPQKEVVRVFYKELWDHAEVVAWPVGGPARQSAAV
jgi:hypothetical protein